MSDSMTMTSAKEPQSEVGKPPFENMVWIPGGTFIMGSDKHYPEEAPAHEVTVEGFWICLLYTSPSPRDRQKSRMPSSA